MSKGSLKDLKENIDKFFYWYFREHANTRYDALENLHAIEIKPDTVSLIMSEFVRYLEDNQLDD